MIKHYWYKIGWLFNTGRVQTNHFGNEVKFYVDNRVDYKRAFDINGEKKIFEWLLNDIEGKRFWDIGSYHGTYALNAVANGVEFVNAFEPNSDNYDRLFGNISLNNFHNKISAHKLALGCDNKLVRLDKRGRNAESKIDITGESVQMRNGDSLDIPQPDTIKIDVEGYECEVLWGMLDTINNIDKIMVEIHDQEDKHEVVSTLEGSGLDAQEWDNRRSQTYIIGERNA